MVKNYIKILFRNFLKNKSTSFINTIGLAIGLASCLMIGLYVTDELSYDGHHEKKNRIYQIYTEAPDANEVFRWNTVPNSVAPYAQKEIPEIEKAGRIFTHNFSGQAFVSTDKIKSMEERFTWADQEILDILTFTFVQGSKEKALSEPNTVIISEAAARKYFGDKQNVLGEVLVIDNDTKLQLKVSGVFKNPPKNSRFQSPIIGSFLSHYFSSPENLSWSNASFETYFLLHQNVTAEEVDRKLNDLVNRNVEEAGRWFTLHLKSLNDLHLYMEDIQDTSNAGNAGDIAQVKILIILGFIVLVIAIVNYVNLSTAQSQKRFKEVGVSKTLGASRGQLMGQFFLETSFYVFIAIFFAIQIVMLLLPAFNNIIQKGISESIFLSPQFIGIVLGSWFLISVLAGFYPAILLSRFSPKQVLKISSAGSSGQAWLRKGLVVTQFSLSTLLIIGTIVLYQQLSFIQTKNLGFKPDQVVAILTTGAESGTQVNTFKKELESIPGIISTTRTQAFPGVGASGRSLKHADNNEINLSIQTVRAGSEIIDALGINILAGRTLPEEKTPGDTTIQIVLNRTAINFLGYSPEEAVGQYVKELFEYPAEIIGVVEDFHFGSLHEKIGAYCFHNARTEGYNFLLVKMETNDIPKTLAQIDDTFRKIIPTDFQFSFVDQRLETLYSQDKQLANVVFIFSSLAIFIACLGLYALASFTAEQRTKEIGIRKALGASVAQVTRMLSKDFIKLVIISFVIAAPIGYYVLSEWLERFAYHIDISIMVYVFAGGVSITIAVVTIAFESIKAARANPVNSLKGE